MTIFEGFTGVGVDYGIDEVRAVSLYFVHLLFQNGLRRTELFKEIQMVCRLGVAGSRHVAMGWCTRSWC